MAPNVQIGEIVETGLCPNLRHPSTEEVTMSSRIPIGKRFSDGWLVFFAGGLVFGAALAGGLAYKGMSMEWQLPGMVIASVAGFLFSSLELATFFDIVDGLYQRRTVLFLRIATGLLLTPMKLYPIWQHGPMFDSRAGYPKRTDEMGSSTSARGIILKRFPSYTSTD